MPCVDRQQIRAWSRYAWMPPVLLLLLIAGQAQVAQAITPESKEVRTLLDKAFKYLATADDNRLGGKCLIGLAFYKDGADESHPKVDAAVKACLAATKGDAAAIGEDIYSTGIAIIFLCELNPSKYADAINKLLKSLELRQKEFGAWGYAAGEHVATGDTSMTQYGVLSTWTVSKVGFGISQTSVEKVTKWILRTQDPSGAWAYQGKEGEINKLVKQDDEKNTDRRMSMTAAALGSLYICADMLQLGDVNLDRDDTLPVALRPKRNKEKGPLTKEIDPKLVREAQKRGRSYWAATKKAEPPGGFTHYYLYALERFQSFIELAEKKQIKEPTWYTEGYNYLKKNQAEDGSWKSAAGPVPDTAFGILFLLRSTKKSIEKSRSYGSGIMLAGRELPRDARQVHVRQGKIVDAKPTAALAKQLTALRAGEAREIAALAADSQDLISAVQAAPAETRAPALQDLRTVVVAGSPEARLVAVRVLGRSSDFDSVPTIVAALSDPDWRVVQEADDTLRFLSREFSAAALPEEPSEKSRAKSIAHWKAWYLAIRPDAEFLN